MSITTPLKKVKGLGSAKEGVSHWWAQRVSALALIFLMAWLVYAVLSLLPLNYAAAIAFLHVPHNAVILMILMCTVFYHGYLGIQVVIEDYVHCECAKIGLLIFLKLANILAVAASLFTIFSVYLKG